MNFYGNPQAPGGRCEQCFCNGNIDRRVPGSCDQLTGECKKCLNNTTGFYCEKCMVGYYGNPKEGGCKECKCDLLGTAASEMNQCDETGQCKCLPNVVGQKCDRCASGFWKIASGQGCEPCACSSVGATDKRCNEFTGQCLCRSTHGGRTCSECQDNHWGDPLLNTCRRCDCDINGSVDHQCDRKTGKCLCRKGISGYKCDQCDRGTTGKLPRCKPCGDCYDNWDKDIKDLSKRTHKMSSMTHRFRETAMDTSSRNALDELSRKLGEISQLAQSSYNRESETESLRRKIFHVQKHLGEQDMEMDDTIESDINVFDKTQSITKEIEDVSVSMNEIIATFLERASSIKDQNSTQILEDVKRLKLKSDSADRKVKWHVAALKNLMRDQSLWLNYTAQLESLSGSFRDNTEGFLILDDKVESLEKSMQQFRSTLCGNAESCSHCWLNCEKGICSVAESCSGFVNMTTSLEDMVESMATTRNDFVEAAKEQLQMTAKMLEEANTTYEEAAAARQTSEVVRTEIMSEREKSNDILTAILEFFTGPRGETDQIQASTEITINTTVDQLNMTEFSTEVTEIIASTENIHHILEMTQAHLSQSQDLLNQTERLKEVVEMTEGEIERIVSKVEKAAEKKKKAQEELDAVDETLEDAGSEMKMIRMKLSDSVVTRGITEMHVKR